MKKVSCITLLSVVVFNTLGGSKSVFEEKIQWRIHRRLYVKQDGCKMSFVGYRYGNFMIFSKLRMSYSRFAYFKEYSKPTHDNNILSRLDTMDSI